jgi:hypothetical protein
MHGIKQCLRAQISELLLNDEEGIALYIVITSTAVFMLHTPPFQDFNPNSSRSDSTSNLFFWKHCCLDTGKIGSSLVESAAVGVLECKL